MNFIENIAKSPVKLVLYVAGIFTVLILLASCWPVASVPTGSRGVITVGGAIKAIEGEGFTLLAPWQKLTLFNIRAEKADIENAEGSTFDTQPVKVSLTVRYSISPNKVSEVYEKYSHDGDLQSYVQTASQEVFKAVTSHYTAPDLIAKRSDVSSDIYTALTKKLAIYGAQVINIDMRNFSFSQSYMAAINDKVTQEQLRLAAENKLKTVESEQKQKVAVAEAEANAVKATADGAAYAKVQVATAEAKALTLQAQAISASPQVLELRRIEVSKIMAERWGGGVPSVVTGNGGILQTLDLNKVMATKEK
jgi:regulator of protease activity HflC (stomatin/prohibitin superfamily)